MIEMTLGQWSSMSPDYRGVDANGLPFVVNVDPQTLATTRERVMLLPVRNTPPDPPDPMPEHYVDIWPLDPRD